MKRWIITYGLLAIILGGIGYIGAIPPPPMGDHLTAADVTYENLNNNGDVGSGATQVAVGNHAHATYTTTSHDHNGGDGAAIPDAALSSGATVVSAGAGDSGKLIKLDAEGKADESVVKDSDVDHGSVGGLADDDHSQYHNDTRGDARYFQKTEHLNTSAGATDAGKPVKLDAGGQIDATMINDADIDHANIGSIGTNSHSTIDTFIASKATSSGLASLDGSTKVIQDPANASTTSIANGIPKANASGLIDSAWLDMVPIGSAYTVSNPSTDRAFNVSSTTINELAAVLGTLITDMNELTKGDSGSIRVEVTGSSVLTDAQVRGTVLTNYGMAAGGDTTLSAYVGSTLFTIVVETAGQAWSLKPPAGEAFTLDGVVLTADYEVDLGQVAGDKASVIRRRTGAATYVWDIHTVQGTHTNGGAS